MEIPLVSQEKKKHNICSIRLDWSYEVLTDFKLEQDKAFK